MLGIFPVCTGHRNFTLRETFVTIPQVKRGSIGLCSDHYLLTIHKYIRLNWQTIYRQMSYYKLVQDPIHCCLIWVLDIWNVLECVCFLKIGITFEPFLCDNKNLKLCKDQLYNSVFWYVYLDQLLVPVQGAAETPVTTWDQFYPTAMCLAV